MYVLQQVKVSMIFLTEYLHEEKCKLAFCANILVRSDPMCGGMKPKFAIQSRARMFNGVAGSAASLLLCACQSREADWTSGVVVRSPFLPLSLVGTALTSRLELQRIQTDVASW